MANEKESDSPKAETSQTATLNALQSTFMHASQIPIFEVDDKFGLWLERLEMHMVQLKITEDSLKVSTLLRSLSSDAYDIIHSICSPETPSEKKFAELCTLLKTQFTTPVIIFQERKKFYTASMTQSETVSSWFARVKKLSIDCAFGTSLNDIVRDKFVMELPPKIFEKLCEETEKLTLTDA